MKISDKIVFISANINVVRVLTNQIILKFKKRNNFLELNYIGQYFPGAAGLSYFNEHELQINLIAYSNNLIAINLYIIDYSVLYKPSKITAV